VVVLNVIGIPAGGEESYWFRPLCMSSSHS